MRKQWSSCAIFKAVKRLRISLTQLPLYLQVQTVFCSISHKSFQMSFCDLSAVLGHCGKLSIFMALMENTLSHLYDRKPSGVGCKHWRIIIIIIVISSLYGLLKTFNNGIVSQFNLSIVQSFHFLGSWLISDATLVRSGISDITLYRDILRETHWPLSYF